MQERIQKQLSRNFLDATIKTKSWQPVVKNGWLIKFSVYKENCVLLLILSKSTSQTIVRHFTSEDYACEYITYIVQLDSAQIQTL
jgi:hypothetical protein